MSVSPGSQAGSCLRTLWPGSITVRLMPGECQVQPGNGFAGRASHLLAGFPEEATLSP